MRVYLPTTLPGLAVLHRAGGVGPPPLAAYAVTPALREWYTSDDLEHLEYAAMAQAARACLPLLAADPAAPRRRVVIAADLPERQVSPQAQADRGAVLLAVNVPLRLVAAVHLDAEAAEKDVAAAVDALPAAERGDDDAAFTVDTVEDHELLWYAVQEIPDLLGGV
jgi:hypothetical protein